MKLKRPTNHLILPPLVALEKKVFKEFLFSLQGEEKTNKIALRLFCSEIFAKEKFKFNPNIAEAGQSIIRNLINIRFFDNDTVA